MENNKNRNKYSAKFKFGIVLETFKYSSGSGSITEIARQNNINSNMISTWRKTFLEKGSLIFESKENSEVLRLKAKISDLEKIIGKKEIELSLIKNFSDFYQSKDTS